MEKLNKQIEFLKEIEKFKTIERFIHLESGRKETDPEHVWHMAMFFIVFEKDLPKDLDSLKMLKMSLIHDLAEIYTGDVSAFDSKGREGKKERELESAKKLFSILPEDLKKEFIDLYLEYSDCKTKESKFVKSFDKLQPLLQNLTTDGKSWKEYNITLKEVEKQKRDLMLHDEFILNVFNTLLKEAKEKNLV